MDKRSRLLPSDPEYLLEYLDTLPNDSDDDFAGYLSDEVDNDESEEQHGPQPTITLESYQSHRNA